jgi:iron complex outermembrane receptor protein
MTMLRWTVTRILLAAAGATALASLAQAQESRRGGLEEIIVTAQKRAESAQDVPIALSVFDSNTLRDANIRRIDEIALRTPNFTMMRVNVGEPQFYIRGVGSTSDSAAGDPTVGVFQDEVYVGRISGAAFDVFDMQRVEVLRGPQGTLYGRNTSGGAVNFVPNRPEQEFFASADLSMGSYGYLEGQVVANGGLTDTISGRLSVSHREHNGYSKNIDTGAELDDEDNWSARAQVLFEPSDANRLLLSYDYVTDDTQGSARVPFPVFDKGQVGAGNNFALAALRRIWPAESNLRRAYSVEESFQERDIDGLTARYEHDASYGSWTILGAWRSVNLAWYEDLDGLKPFGFPPVTPPFPTPYGWVLKNRDIADEEAEQYSLEARLASPSDSKLKWVAGLYLFDESVERTEQFITQFSLLAAAGGDVTFGQDVDSTSYAVFGQMTYPITEQLGITAGLRYSDDEKDAHQTAVNNNPADATPGIPLFPGQPYDISASDSWNPLTGKLGIDYRTENGNLLYGLISRGHKSGIFPSQNNVIQNVGEATPPEEVWNYEAGAKTQWANDTLRANIALFYMDYSDLQLFRLDPQLRLVTFTEDTTNYGAELELLAAPDENIEVGLNLAWLTAEVDGGVNDGAELPRAPEFSAGIFAQFGWELWGGSASVRTDLKWTDDYRTEIAYNTGNAAADAANARITEVNSFTLLDMRAVWAPGDGNFELSLWGKNLLDETYPTHIIPFFGNGFSIFGPPRTYGVSIGWRSR